MDDPSLLKKKYDICISSLNNYMHENYKLLEELNNLVIKNNELKNTLDQNQKIKEEIIFKKDLIIINLEHENCDLEIKIKNMEETLNELNMELETKINTKLNSTISHPPVFTKKNTISYDHDKLNNYRKFIDDEKKNENTCCCLIL